jgi:hypothetical protein
MDRVLLEQLWLAWVRTGVLLVVFGRIRGPTPPSPRPPFDAGLQSITVGPTLGLPRSDYSAQPVRLKSPLLCH